MENKKQVKDPYRSALKKKAMAFMPKNYEDVNAQKQILSMIVAVVPAAAGIVKAAETGLWPKVQGGSLPIIQAVGQCALEVNKAIAAAPVESLLLEKRSSESLLKAWVSLDYYAYLMLPEYSGNIRALRDRMFAILRQRDTGNAPAAPVAPQPIPQAEDPNKTVMVERAPAGLAEDPNKTVMVERAPAGLAEDPNKTVMVEREPEIPTDSMKTQFTPQPEAVSYAAAEEIGATVSVAREEVSEVWEPAKKSRSKMPIFAVLAVVAIVAVVALVLGMGSAAVTKVEEAIDAIGTVSLESKDEIEAAEVLYEDLSEGNQKKVENRDTLFAARSEYDRQADAVAQVEEAINAISSPVTLKSGDAVRKARKLYDALDADLKDDVSNYATLKSKEEAYTELYNEEQAGILYASALKDYEAGNYDAALGDIADLLKKYPGTSVDGNAKTLGADSAAQLAMTALTENRLEDAMTLLTQAEGYKKTDTTASVRDKLVARLNNNRPSNGRLFATKAEQGYCKMVITAAGSDICIKLTSNENSEKYTIFYIREGETFSMYLKDGSYTMHYAYGDYWYGEEAMFGENGHYKKVDHDFELNTSYSGWTITYEYYEFTLNTDSSGMNETAITRSQF